MATDAPLSLHEAAERLGVHYMTAYRYVRTGRLPATQRNGEWRVTRTDVDRFKRQHRPQRGRAGAGAVDRRPVRERFQRCAVRGDEAAAWQIVEDALTSGAAPSDVLIDVVIGAMHSIGERWSSGDVSVAGEHTATAVVGRIVARLGPQFARRGRSQGTVVLGTVAGDPHSLGVHVLADLLRGDGFRVRDLGGDTPIGSFVEAAKAAERLTAIGVASYVTGRDRNLRQLVRALRRDGVRAPIVMGGAGIPSAAAAEALGADAYAPDMRAASALCRELVLAR